MSTVSGGYKGVHGDEAERGQAVNENEIVVLAHLAHQFAQDVFALGFAD
jgi:hypothetical protein